MNKQNIVTFTDHDHSYWLGDERLESVSHVFKHFVKPYNALYHSLRMALKELRPGIYSSVPKGRSDDEFAKYLIPVAMKYPDVVSRAADIRAEWLAGALESTTGGTTIHTYLEDRSIERGWERNPFTGHRSPVFKSLIEGANNRAFSDNLLDLPDGYYPELLMFNKKFMIAGQSDKVFIHTKSDRSRWAYFDDWKTDKPERMTRSAFWHPTYGKQKFLAPIDHIEDAAINTYEFKIGIYAWMMEQFGFNIGGIRITHVDRLTGAVTIYPLRYKQLEVSMLLDAYHQDVLESRAEKQRRARVSRFAPCE